MADEHVPMFKLLLETLKNEPPETKAMFFADSEEDLTKAYQEGMAARSKKKLLSSNPYPPLPNQGMDGGLYGKNLCWQEGFLAVYLTEY